MTVTTTMPDDVVFGKVVGRFLLAVGDSFDDDRLPDATPASGTITFSPVVPNFRVNIPGPATIVKAPIRCSIDNSGRLLDTNQSVGVWLIAGQYRVTYALEGMTIDSHTIEVTTDHDDDSPLDLTNALPPSGPVITPTQYSELSGRIDALDIPVDSVNGMVGDVVLDAADVGAYSRVETDDKFATQQALTDAQFAAIPPPPVTSVNGEVGAVQLTAGEVGAYTKAEVDTRVDAAKFSAAGATDGFVATATGNGSWAWEAVPLPPDTGADGTYRGAWDSARLYEAGDQVTIGGILWVATEQSQGVLPATTVQINPAGGDGGPGSYSLLQMYGNVQQVLHPIRTNRDVLIGSISVYVHETGMPAIKVGIAASTPALNGSSPATLITPATSAAARAGTGWKEIVLDDPIQLQAETDYWIYLESASGLGQLNGHFNNGYVAYSGALEGAAQTADIIRGSAAATWGLADRRTYIQVGEYEPQAWEPLADLAPETAPIAWITVTNPATDARPNASRVFWVGGTTKPTNMGVNDLWIKG